VSTGATAGATPGKNGEAGRSHRPTVLTQILDPILHLRGLPVYLIVGGLVFAEAAIFLGFVFPGETAVILGGVIASEGHVSLGVLIPVVVICAIVGDTVGYFIGNRFGTRLLEARLLRRRRRTLEGAVDFLRRRGAFAVFAGRFTAFLRAVVPGLAGLSEMRYRTFLLANAAGALVWGVAFTLIGYAVGNAYRRAEQVASWASWVVLGVVVLGYVALVVRSRRRDRALEAGDGAEGNGAEGTGVEGNGGGEDGPNGSAGEPTTVTRKRPPPN
jgi:membrane-associated protein